MREDFCRIVPKYFLIAMSVYLEKITLGLREWKRRWVHKPSQKPDDYYNEYALTLPTKKNPIERVFPDKVLWLLLICIIIKVTIFCYGIYLNENSISPSIQSIFVDWVKYWWDLEGLSDFKGDYIMFRNNWLNGEALYSEAFKGRYLYPPLFYYIIHIFARWTIYSAPIVMLICNILTGYFVFRLAKQFGAQASAAKAMMVICLLSPFNLYYSDFIWQNTGVFTTFVVISMFLITKEKYTQAMIWLGIAVSIKHNAAFFLPVFVFGISYKLYSKPKEKWISRYTLLQYISSIPYSTVIYYSLIPFMIFIVSSFPYIYENPTQYFGILLGSFGPTNYDWLSAIFSRIVEVYGSNGELIGYFPDLTIAEGNTPYRVNYRTAIDVAFAWLGHLLGIPVQYTIILSFLFHSQVLMLGSVAIVFLLYWRIAKNQRCLTDQEYYWIIWYAASLSFFASVMFAEIGIYKYYLVSLAPMWAIYDPLMVLNHDKWKRPGLYKITDVVKHPEYLEYQLFGGGSALHIGEQFVLQLGMMYCNKWLAPAYFYLPLFLWGVIRLWIVGRPTVVAQVQDGIESLYYSPKYTYFEDITGLKQSMVAVSERPLRRAIEEVLRAVNSKRAKKN